MAESIKVVPARVYLDPQVLFQALDEEAVLLDLASERYLVLNELGRRLWELLSADGDTSAALTRLLEEYQVDEITLRADVAAWIEKLVKLKLASLDGPFPEVDGGS
jgi:hypothetical protein